MDTHRTIIGTEARVSNIHASSGKNPRGVFGKRDTTGNLYLILQNTKNERSVFDKLQQLIRFSGKFDVLIYAVFFLS